MRNSFMQSLMGLAEREPDVMLLTADLGFGVFEEFEQRFPLQYLNVGVAEQNMVGVGTGLALEGRKVFAYSIANFPTLRCLEQIRNDACYHGVNLNIVCSGGGFNYGALGMSHHATEDLGILRALPGICVVAPGDAWEAAEATTALAERSGVGYLRLEKTVTSATNRSDDTFELGRACRLRDGDAVTFIASGGILSVVLEAADRLAVDGIECRVLSMHTVKPLDVDEVIKAAGETGGIITVEEHNVLAGLGGAVAEVCMERNAHPGFFRRVGLQDMYSSIVGSQAYLRSRYGMDADHIEEMTRTLVTGAPI